MLDFLNVGISFCEISYVLSVFNPRFARLECQSKELLGTLVGISRWAWGFKFGRLGMINA